MISESTSEYWKKEVLLVADRLEARYNQKSWSDESVFLLEKDIFLGFFSLRKLIESNKVATAVAKNKISVMAYPANETEITLLGQYKLAELYNLYSGQEESLDYVFICSRFIHSVIFSPFIPFDESLCGFFFASDWDKGQKIYYMTLVKVIEIFRSVGNNYLSTLDVSFDAKKKEYVVESHSDSSL